MNTLDVRQTAYFAIIVRLQIAAYLFQVIVSLFHHLNPPFVESSKPSQNIFSLQLEEPEKFFVPLKESRQPLLKQAETYQVNSLVDESSGFYNCQQISLLQTVLESFIDGILIVTDLGEWIHANEFARQICRQMNRDPVHRDYVPKPIWHICKSLINESNAYPEDEVTVEAEIAIGQLSKYRVRSRWLSLEEIERPCLLVTLTDQIQSIKNLAIAEARKYGFTSSETKVWLLYCLSYSYKQIANELYISENTVKKHMKSVHLKRKQITDEEVAS